MVFDKIKSIIVDQLDADENEVTMEANIQDDLGADSLDVVDLIQAIEDEFGVTIPDEILEKVVTVQDAYDLVKTIG